jgi:hypothetical protein
VYKDKPRKKKMRVLKQKLKVVRQLLLVLLIIFPLVTSVFPVAPFMGETYADAAPITPLDVINQKCPTNTAFTHGDKTHAPSCYKFPPSSQSDCPPGSTFNKGTSGLGAQASSCTSAGDHPSSQSDCPAGSKFSQGAGGLSGQQNSCVFNGSYPTSQKDCNKLGSGYRFNDGHGLNPNTCTKPSDNPTSQKDCNSTGTIFQQGKSGLTPTPASCAAPSQAAQTACKGKSGEEYAGCVVGYDTGGCSIFTGNALQDCQDAQNKAANAGGNGTSEGQLTCDTSFSSGVLLWAICGVVEVLVPIVNGIDNIITNQLTINTGSIFCGTSSPTCSAYHQAWAQFRNIALGLMVIAGLVVLISQSLGFELLDAYMLRKTLPRLLIAAIGITLSWPLMNFAVTLSNDLGFGIRHLIYGPFTNLGNNIDLNFSGGAIEKIFGFGVAGNLTAIAAVPAWIAFGGPLALFAYLGTAALAVFIAILVLVMRQVAIIMMILLAPIAIAAYILPNTQRVYHLWWESFSKALMMFPLIAGFIAAGRVFSAISLSQGGVIGGFIGFIAYFAPYFLIPATFKLAGGAVRQLGGFVNDRSRGGFDRLRNLRNNEIKRRVAAARGPGLYKKKDGFQGFLNRAGFYTLEADHQIPYMLGSGTGLAKGKYNPLGVGGRALFGGQAKQMAFEKAKAARDHNRKAAEDMALDYRAGYAIEGHREKMLAGLGGEDSDIVKSLDRRFGTGDVYDSSIVNADGSRGNTVKRWKTGNMPGATDANAWESLGKELYASSSSGSDAKAAGEELMNKGGKLARLGLNHEETGRANIHSVAQTVLSHEGKASPDDLARWRTRGIDAAGGDLAGVAIASAVADQNESLASNNRNSIRGDKTIKMLQHDGKNIAYSVLGQKVQVGTDKATGKPLYRTEKKNDDGSVTVGQTTDENHKDLFVPYKTKEAKDLIVTGRRESSEGSKGEIVDDYFDAFAHWTNPVEIAKDKGGQVTDVERAEAQQIKENFLQQSSSWARNDPGARAKLKALYARAGISEKEAATYVGHATSGDEAEAKRVAAEAGQPYKQPPINDPNKFKT